MKYTAFISYRHSSLSRLHAERMERALKRYSKPLWKPPIAIFRDERVLRPGDNLPASIRRALESSEFLIYFAAKEAAESEWVRDELRIWCEELKRAANLILVHLSDRIVVHRPTNSILWSETDAIPPLLAPYIEFIPIWADLTGNSKDEDLDLNNVEYKKQINAIIARFRGKTPGEMNDEEVRTHRRNIRLRNTGVTAIAASAVIAVYFGFTANQDRRLAQLSEHRAVTSARLAEDRRTEAEKEKNEAEKQRKEAERRRIEADEQKRQANVQRARAENQTRIAVARQLAADAELATNERPNKLYLGALLAVESMRRLPLVQSDKVLRNALDLMPRNVALFSQAAEVYSVAFAPNGRMLISASKDNTAKIWPL